MFASSDSKHSSESPNIVDVNSSNAKAILIDESQRRIVMVDFWADWCGPCKSLMPILEKLAQEYQGQLLLARVNADSEPGLAAQFGVRSLPTVFIMKDGQPIDGFMGAQPEKAIRELLEKHLPKPWDLDFQTAQALIADQQYGQALPLLRQAHEQSRHRSDIGLRLALVYLELNRAAEAQAIIEAIPLADQDALYDKAKAILALKLAAAKSPAIEALQAKLNADPTNLEVAYQLALQFSQDDHSREALELLYSILQKKINFQEGAAKKTMMDLLASLGKGDPLAVEFQRKLYTLLY